MCQFPDQSLWPGQWDSKSGPARFKDVPPYSGMSSSKHARLEGEGAVLTKMGCPLRGKWNNKCGEKGNRGFLASVNGC